MTPQPQTARELLTSPVTQGPVSSIGVIQSVSVRVKLRAKRKYQENKSLGDLNASSELYFTNLYNRGIYNMSLQSTVKS